MRDKRWLLPALTLVLLVLGAVAVAIAVTLALTGFGDDPAVPSSSGPAPSQPAQPAVPASSSQPVSTLADPSWVAGAAVATGIAEADLAAYAGASIAVERTHPQCDLGWNTLAAIATMPVGPNTLEPMGITSDVWSVHGTDGDGDGRLDAHDIDDAALTVAVHLCSVGRDARQGPAWSAAIAAHHPGAAYARRVSAEADRLAAAASAAAPSTDGAPAPRP